MVNLIVYLHKLLFFTFDKKYLNTLFNESFLLTIMWMISIFFFTGAKVLCLSALYLIKLLA